MTDLMSATQLGQFVGIHSPATWADPTSLFRAKARVSALDESPLKNEALNAIESAITAAYETLERDASLQREAAEKIIEHYRAGVSDLAQTWESLRTLVEPGWADE